MRKSLGLGLVATALVIGAPALAQSLIPADLDARIQEEFPRAVAWRRNIHQHPELGNREIQTARLVADLLKKLGLEVRTGIAHTGVVGILRGGKSGEVIALRSELDALPVLEKTGLPFASKITAEYEGRNVPVMHACGHDGHIAMLMAAAELLAGIKDQIPGTIIFLFQPAEEGSPQGEDGGAPLMIKDGALSKPKPDAIFGLHLLPGPVGYVILRPGPFMAGSDTMRITLHGKGTHGAEPWGGIDLSSLTAAIVQALNTIAARQVDVTAAPTVITVGMIQIGTRFNVIADEAKLAGTVRTYGEVRRADVLARIRRTVEDLADSYGATADITFDGTTPAVENDAGLTAELMPALAAAAGPAGVDSNHSPVTTAEDFSYYGGVAPALFVHLGSTPNFTDYTSAPRNHSPNFDIDERAMLTGIKLHVLVALTFLFDHAGAPHL